MRKAETSRGLLDICSSDAAIDTNAPNVRAGLDAAADGATESVFPGVLRPERRAVAATTRALKESASGRMRTGYPLAVDSPDRFDSFRRLVLDDPSLQAQLQSIPAWPEFVQAAVVAAGKRGVLLTADEVLSAREAAKRSWLERWV
jgi:hypothetical protein